MAYTLFFWCDTSTDTRSPERICERLCAEEDVEEVAWLPVADIRRRFGDAFPEIDNGLTELNWEGSDSYFQVTWPTGSKPGHTLAIFVDCGYQLLDCIDVMNRIIDVANSFGCALYDPQTGERYQQPSREIG